MAEPRATINPLELDKPMSMNEFEYEIAQQGFFEKNTTERDGTLQVYNRKATAYQQGETSKNTLFTRKGVKYSDKTIGGIAKFDVNKFIAEHNITIKGKLINAFLSNQVLWVLTDLAAFIYYLDTGEAGELDEDIVACACGVNTGADCMVFLRSDNTFGTLTFDGEHTIIENLGRFTFETNNPILTAYFEQDHYIMVSLIDGQINGSINADSVFGETRVIEGLRGIRHSYDIRILSTSPNFSIDDNNAVIYNGYQLSTGKPIKANTRIIFGGAPPYTFSKIVESGVTKIGISCPAGWKTEQNLSNITYKGSITQMLGCSRLLQRINSVDRLHFGYIQPYLQVGELKTKYRQDNVGYIKGDGDIQYNPYGFKNGELVFMNNTLVGISINNRMLEPAFTVDEVTNIFNGKITYKIKDKLYIAYYDPTLEREIKQLGDNIISNNGNAGEASGFNLNLNIGYNAYPDYANFIIPTCQNSGAVTQYAFVSAVSDDAKSNSFGASLAPSVPICEYLHPINEVAPFMPYYNDIHQKEINAYGSSTNLSMPSYLWSTKGDDGRLWEKQNLKDTFYLGGGESGLFYFSDITFSDGDIGFIKGSGVFKLLEKEGRPYFWYKSLSDIGQVDEMFVIQKQAFIIRNNCIYSVMFSNTDIADYEFVVNLGAVKFIGNTPNIAFFYNENTKQIYGFTGSSSVEFLFYGYKLKGLRKFFKNYSEMGIIISTDERVFLIQGEDIFYRPIPKVDNVYFLNDRIVYMSESEGIVEESMQDIGGEWLPCHLKTLYIGGGRNDLQESNCWYLTVYNRRGLESGSVKMTSRVINQKTLESQEKVLELQASDFTVEGLAFIRLQPQVQNTVGASVEIVSDFDIDYLALGFMPQGVQQISRFNL